MKMKASAKVEGESKGKEKCKTDGERSATSEEIVVVVNSGGARILKVEGQNSTVKHSEKNIEKKQYNTNCLILNVLHSKFQNAYSFTI